MFTWQLIIFKEGNPYICRTEKEFKRIAKKYNLIEVKKDCWKEV